MLILLLSLMHSLRLQKITTIEQFGTFNNWMVFIDKFNNAHIVVNTDIGIKSFNIKGELEWYVPRYKALFPFGEPYFNIKNNLFIAFKKENLNFFVINLLNGKIEDSFKLNLPCFPLEANIVYSDSFIILAPYTEGRIRERKGFLIRIRDKNIKIKEIQIPAPSFKCYENAGILYIAYRTPFNNAKALNGVSDYFPGIITVSKKTGDIITRFIVALPGYYLSTFYKHPQKNIFLLSIYPNPYTTGKSSSQIYTLEIPDFKKLKSKEFNSMVCTTEWIRMEDKYVFVTFDILKGIISVVDENFNTLRNFKFEKEFIPVFKEKTYTQKSARIWAFDVNKDKRKDIVIIEFYLNLSYDKRGPGILDNRGDLKSEFLFYVFLNPFNHKPSKIKTEELLGGGRFVGIFQDKNKNTFFVIENLGENKIEIYKLIWED